MVRKFIITAELRDLESQVARGEISYSKMIEILNEKAEKYAKDKVYSIEEVENLLYEAFNVDWGHDADVWINKRLNLPQK